MGVGVLVGVAVGVSVGRGVSVEVGGGVGVGVETGPQATMMLKVMVIHTSTVNGDIRFIFMESIIYPLRECNKWQK